MFQLSLKRMRKFGSVASVQFPSPESSAQYQTARITFSSGDIALKAVRKMDKKVLDGAVIRAGFPVQKCARVIVRNLPFNCTTKRVRTVLKQFGPVRCRLNAYCATTADCSVPDF